MSTPISLLVIEENPKESSLIMKQLSALKPFSYHYSSIHAKNLSEALLALKNSQYDVILCDLFLPDSQGIPTFYEIEKKAKGSPIILMGNTSDTDLGKKAIQQGAQDFIVKSEINSRLFTHAIPFAIERQRLHESLKALSFTDELTKVYNRRGFITLTEQQIELTKRLHQGFYLFYIDLDFLKEINDTFGHQMGDQALIDTAQAIQSSFRTHDIVGRLGGDEFGIIAIHAPKESLEQLSHHLLQKVMELQSQKHRPYSISLSLGSTYYDGRQESSVENLISEADRNLYLAKKQVHAKHNSITEQKDRPDG